MSRRRQAIKREVSDDPKFNSALVSRLVNMVMGSGKKTLAQRIVYGTFDKIAEKNPNSNPLEILQRAVENAKPETRLFDLFAESFGWAGCTGPGAPLTTRGAHGALGASGPFARSS